MILEDVEVISFRDNILILRCGATDSEARIDHNCNLIAVLERFEQQHTNLNFNKGHLYGSLSL